MPREHSAIFSTCNELSPVIKTFVLSVIEWLLKTGLLYIETFFNECLVASRFVKWRYPLKTDTSNDKFIYKIEFTFFIQGISEAQGDATSQSDSPQCCACGEARYKMVFQGLWSKQTHPKGFPTGRGMLTYFSRMEFSSYHLDQSISV